MMSSSFEQLLDQIDSFIRKYYKNEMIKGVILFLAFFLFSFLFTTTLEYIGRFGSVTRAFLFFSFIVINLILLVRYIVIPLSKLISFGKRINRYQASEIIGSFFPEISDRLKNTLQLHDALDQNEGNIELLRASVMQKSEQLNVIPFSIYAIYYQYLQFSFC
jgi:ABC-type multidrug transport system fused ATPase/permease subunit